MIVPIQINETDLLSQFYITSQQMNDVIDFVVKETTALYADHWRHQAQIELHSTRDRYIANLNVLDEGRMKGAVVLDYTRDKLVRMIEEGASAFDMKAGFSKSQHVSFKEDGGWYLTIPFRIGTPSAIGEAGGIGTIMSEETYKSAKQLGSKESLKTEQLSSIEQLLQTRSGVSSIPESKTFQEYKHKGAILAGMVKINDPVTKQNTYMTFRRVSDNSDQDSWVYRGLIGYGLAEKAYADFESKLPEFLGLFLDDALSEFNIQSR